MPITPNGKLAVIILPCGNRSTNLPVRQTVNTALKAFAPHPSFEVKHSLDSDTGFFHAGILTDKLSEVMREIKAQCPEVEDIIILGGTYARHPSDSNVETYVLPISQEFPQATFHFLYPGTLYFVAEDGETDFTANDLHQKEPRIEGLNARHWTSLEKMYMHFAGNDRERAIASLGEAVRIHVQGTAYLPATSVPVFVISAPISMSRGRTQKVISNGNTGLALNGQRGSRPEITAKRSSMITPLNSPTCPIRAITIRASP